MEISSIFDALINKIFSSSSEEISIIISWGYRRCVDQLHIFPHLKEPIIQDTKIPEETICMENAYNWVTNTSSKTQDFYTAVHAKKDENTFNINTNQVEFSNNQDTYYVPSLSRESFRIENRRSIFSSEKILGMRLMYAYIQEEKAFQIAGKFRFIDKNIFKNDGNLVPTTYCDYQFLPHPINYVKENKLGSSLWRNFHSPRYPAKYPEHIKCTYRFVGRPRNRVEVLFEEIYLLTGHISCLHHTDKITVYDSKIPDKSSIVDVFCNEKPSRRVTSTGPYLLIEFEASSNRTSNGFSAKYRFVDIFQTLPVTKPLTVIAENLSSSRENHNKNATDDMKTSIDRTNFPLTTLNLKETKTLTVEITESSLNESNFRQQLEHHYVNQKINRIIGLKHENNHEEERTNDDVDGSIDEKNSIHTRTISSNMNISNNVTTVNGVESNHSIIVADDAVPTTTTGAAAARLCPPGSNCDKVLYSTSTKNGTIQTPMFPGPYPSRTLCRYEFQGQGRERIQIKFFEFSLPSEGDSYDCEEADTLQVFLPIRGRYEPVETLCGETMPKPIMSNGPRMLLEFRGRQSGRGNRGFKAEYQFLENFGIISGRQLPEVECAFVFNSSESRSGWFYSPNFPGLYPRNLECSYYFYGGPLDKILIRFTYFDVEGLFPCEESSASDYVEFSNFLSIDRKFRRHCGKKTAFSIRSDGKFFRITFRTNDRFDKTGFQASYSFEADEPTTENNFIPDYEITNAAGYDGMKLDNLLQLLTIITLLSSVCYYPIWWTIVVCNL